MAEVAPPAAEAAAPPAAPENSNNSNNRKSSTKRQSTGPTSAGEPLVELHAPHHHHAHGHAHAHHHHHHLHGGGGGGGGGGSLERVGSRKLIDILVPHEPLPVILPKIGDLRKNKEIARKLAAKSASGATAVAQTQDDEDEELAKRHEVPFIPGDDDPNPFEHPKNIEEFIVRCELERTEKRKEDANVPSLMKGTSLYKQSQQVLARIKPFLTPTFKPSLANDYKKVVWRAQHGLHINHLQKVSRKLHTEYIMQRKTIYYLRRAVRARKIALEMLQRNREYEEERLKEFEWLTEFTNDTFEQFLKENDEATHHSAKMAENALKEKLEKILEIRDLNIHINQLKTDIISTNEGLRECKIYMRFLDDIAREIMRKDEEEEIRAYYREQQVKEELIDLLKQGVDLEEAQQIIERRAKEFEDDKNNAGLEKIEEKKVVTTNDNEEDEEEEGEGDDEEGENEDEEEDTEENHFLAFGARGGSVAFIETLNKKIRTHLGLSEEASEDPKKAKKKEILTPMGIVGALVTKHKSRLHSAVPPHEKKGSLVSDGAPLRLALHEDYTGIDVNDASNEDEDGYNELALLKSIDLVPGDEKTDRMELASLRFTRPSQLLQIYSDMEEANLSLIQHSQASEELLERVNHQIFNTRKQLNHKAYSLRDEINRVQANIDQNEERAQALAMLVEMFTGGNFDVRQQQKLYRILQNHVTKVYKTAVGSVDNHLNPIMMLTSVEKNFEDLMREIQAMPSDVVIQISRELDKERREMERVEKMNKRKAVQEERKTRQMARAEAPIPRRKGRPLLPRSHPPKIVIELSQAELDKKAEEDEFNYFFGP